MTYNQGWPGGRWGGRKGAYVSHLGLLSCAWHSLLSYDHRFINERMLTLGKPEFQAEPPFAFSLKEDKRLVCPEVDEGISNKPSYPKCGFCHQDACHIHTMSLMAVNSFYRILKLVHYRRYIYYQEENSTDCSCVVALFIPVIARFSGWEQNGSFIIQSKTVLAFMTYMVNHIFILCFQTAPFSISILESKKPFVVLITIFQHGSNLLRFPYWHIIFDHFRQRFESSVAT